MSHEKIFEIRLHYIRFLYSHHDAKKIFEKLCEVWKFCLESGFNGFSSLTRLRTRLRNSNFVSGFHFWCWISSQKIYSRIENFVFFRNQFWDPLFAGFECACKEIMDMHSKHDRLVMSHKLKSQRYLRKGWCSLLQHILTKILAYVSQWNHSSIIYEKTCWCHQLSKCHQHWTAAIGGNLTGLNESLGPPLTDDIGHVSSSDF